MNYEQLLTHIDGFSGFTFGSVLLIGLLSAIACMENFANNFISPALDHWCYVPALDGLSQQTQRHLVVPGGEKESCHTYDIPWHNYSTEELMSWNWSSVDVADYQQITCQQGWVYDNSTFNKATATSEWDLVCGEEIILDLLSPVYLIGLLFGSLASGPMSDRFGRLKSILIFMVVYLVGGVCAIFAPNVWLYMLGRHFLGVTIRGANLVGIVLMTEMTIPRYRSRMVVAHRMFFVSGMLLSSLLGYYVRHFRVYQFALVAPVVFILPSLAWLFPESPRWLLSKGRVEDTVKAISKLARRYRRTIPPEIIHEYAHQKVVNVETSSPVAESKTRTRDMLSHPVLRKYTLVIGYCKMAGQFVYFAVSMNMGSLVGDLYLNTLIAGAMEMPALLLVLWTISRYGRKPTVAVSFAIASISGAVSIAFLLVDGADMGATVALIICRTATSCAMAGLNTYTGELFPTPIRQSAVGLTSAISALVSVFAPFAGGPLLEVWSALPNIIFTVLISIGVFLILLLPETLNQRLPETTEDSVDLMSNGKKSGVRTCLPCLQSKDKETSSTRPTTPDAATDAKTTNVHQPVYVLSPGDCKEAGKSASCDTFVDIRIISDGVRRPVGIPDRISMPQSSPDVAAENYLTLGRVSSAPEFSADGHTNSAFLPDIDDDYFNTKL